MGAPQNDILKYEKIVSAYGNVTPAVVAMNEGIYSLIDGYARLEACVRAGIGEIPAVIAYAEGEEERAKLSLLLSASREQGGALSEGALVDMLVTKYGQTLGELSKLIGRSKAWLSKRQAMTRNLTQPLKEMVIRGTVCTRTAEEISKLPQEKQASFATNVIKECLSKNDVSRLVKLYSSPDANLALCRMIIDSPAEALLACPEIGKAHKHGKGRQGEDGRIRRAAHCAVNILEGIGKMIVDSDKESISSEMDSLLKLRGKMQMLTRMISSHVAAGVSPGKQEGGQID